MSWSIYNMIGTPDKIAEALDKQSAKLDGASKEEFDSVLPHIKAIVGENIASNPPVLQLNGSGHGSKNGDGVWTHKTCSVEIKNLGGTLV